MQTGVIIKGVGGMYLVDCGAGLFECSARGVFRKDALKPLPGDVVSVQETDCVKYKGMITKIHDRKNALIRPAVANVTQIVIIISPKMPEPDLLLVDKLIAVALSKSIECIICLNKHDLDDASIFEDIAWQYERSGIKVIATSLFGKEGYNALKGYLAGRISVFAGQSGVGKSTVLNKIIDRVVMETGDLSKKVDRGKHTTRHAQLFSIDGGGYIADTPGFSSFELEFKDAEDLKNYYYEFTEYKTDCKFNDCRHINEPDCSVKDAILKGYISEGRYERYKYLYEALKSKNNKL